MYVYEGLISKSNFNKIYKVKIKKAIYLIAFCSFFFLFYNKMGNFIRCKNRSIRCYRC